MKFKMNKNRIKFLLASMLLAASLPALALTGDSDKPVNIDSENQSLDLQGNVATFTGNVIVTRGSIKITADKVVVTRPGGDSKRPSLMLTVTLPPFTRCRTTANRFRVMRPNCIMSLPMTLLS